MPKTKEEALKEQETPEEEALEEETVSQGEIDDMIGGAPPTGKEALSPEKEDDVTDIEPEPKKKEEELEPEEEEPEKEEEPEPEKKPEEEEELEEEEEEPLKAPSEADVLRDTIKQLSDELSAHGVAKPEPEPREGEEPEKKEPEKKERDLVQFIGEEGYEEVIASPEALNKVLNVVYNTAIEHLMRGVSPVIGRVVQEQTQLQALVSDFYKVNDDLIPHRSFVGFVTNEMASKHPDLSYEELFGKVGSEVRKRLDLHQRKEKEVDNREKGKKRPAFVKKPKGGGLKSPKDDRTSLQKDIDGLLSH